MKKKSSRGGWDTKRTFVVLEVPSPVAETVLAVRRKFGSWRLALPVEITLAGSSGLGVLRYHESELGAIFGILGGVARGFAPITARFGSVAIFPGTRVFYLAPDDPAPFFALQAALAKSGLRFERSPFAFVPHCTLADLETAALDLPANLHALALTDTEIVLETLSVYNLDSRVLGGNPAGCRLLHRTKLGAP